jgi:hypothetical protein
VCSLGIAKGRPRYYFERGAARLIICRPAFVINPISTKRITASPEGERQRHMREGEREVQQRERFYFV